jgi:outer membrane biosynthesis protein TonB
LDEWRLKVTTLLEVTTLAKTVDELKQPIYSSTDNSTSKAKIKEKPRAHYTEQALGKTEGTVRLLVVFGADGQIKAILPVKELKNGLTYEAIKAARQIKFEPATKDGKPVMSYALVEYSFSTKIT